MFENREAERERKKQVIANLDELILDEDLSAEDRVRLLDARRKEKNNGLDVGDILKVVANVTIVAVLIGFETTQILSQKGSRFIKVL